MGPVKVDSERKENEKSIIAEVKWDKEKDAGCQYEIIYWMYLVRKRIRKNGTNKIKNKDKRGGK